MHQQEINELANELLCKKINNFQERFLLRPIVDFPIIRSRFYPLLYLHADSKHFLCEESVHIFGMTNGICTYFRNDHYKLALTIIACVHE